MRTAKKNKLARNEEPENWVLKKMEAGRNRAIGQTTLLGNYVKRDVPWLCPETCKHKKDCTGCLTHSRFEPISKEEYDQMQKGVVSGYLK